MLEEATLKQIIAHAGAIICAGAIFCKFFFIRMVRNAQGVERLTDEKMRLPNLSRLSLTGVGDWGNPNARCYGCANEKHDQESHADPGGCQHCPEPDERDGRSDARRNRKFRDSLPPAPAPAPAPAQTPARTPAPAPAPTPAPYELEFLPPASSVLNDLLDDDDPPPSPPELNRRPFSPRRPEEMPEAPPAAPPAAPQADGDAFDGHESEDLSLIHI